MNKLAKIGLKALGCTGGLIAAALISNGTNTLIRALDKSESSSEDGSTTDKDEAE